MAFTARRRAVAGPGSRRSEVEAESLKALVLDAVRDIKGRSVVALDVSAQTDVTDHMVIVSGSSGRHVNAIVDRVLEAVKDRGVQPLGVEGREAGDWVLLDLADVVVHVMREESRAFYDLEGLWGAGDADATAMSPSPLDVAVGP